MSDFIALLSIVSTIHDHLLSGGSDADARAVVEQQHGAVEREQFDCAVMLARGRLEDEAAENTEERAVAEATAQLATLTEWKPKETISEMRGTVQYLADVVTDLRAIHARARRFMDQGEDGVWPIPALPESLLLNLIIGITKSARVIEAFLAAVQGKGNET
jgi:hypothetical protein